MRRVHLMAVGMTSACLVLPCVGIAPATAADQPSTSAELVAGKAAGELADQAARTVPAGDRSGAAARAAVPASGKFDASVDLSSITLRDTGSGKCELTVNGTLTFRQDGTLVGVAQGVTTALIFAPCALVGVTPPGTYFDVFRFKGAFTGTVNGKSANGELTYAGVTSPGGAIDAVIVLRGAATAVLRANAIVAQGGTYAGIVKT